MGHKNFLFERYSIEIEKLEMIIHFRVEKVIKLLLNKDYSKQISNLFSQVKNNVLQYLEINKNDKKNRLAWEIFPFFKSLLFK